VCYLISKSLWLLDIRYALDAALVADCHIFYDIQNIPASSLLFCIFIIVWILSVLPPSFL